MKKRTKSAGRAKGGAADVDRIFGRVVDAFAGDPLVTRETTRGFGSGALKVRGRIFAMITSKAQLVVKLPRRGSTSWSGPARARASSRGRDE